MKLTRDYRVIAAAGKWSEHSWFITDQGVVMDLGGETHEVYVTFHPEKFSGAEIEVEIETDEGEEDYEVRAAETVDELLDHGFIKIRLFEHTLQVVCRRRASGRPFDALWKFVAAHTEIDQLTVMYEVFNGISLSRREFLGMNSINDLIRRARYG